MIEIVNCKKFNQIQLEELIGLMSQLCPECPPLTAVHLDQIMNHPTTQLFVAVDLNQIIGAITFVWYPIPTALRAWVEDVVVDKNHRGKKIGEALVLYVINEAKKLGIKQVDLTSRPDRVEANKLYQKLGFQKRETNVYRLYLKDTILS